MLTIYRAADIVEAHIVAGMLEAHGIQCFVGGHYLQGAVGRLPVMDTATVLIHEDREAEARPLIEAYESNRIEEPEAAGGATPHGPLKPA